MLGFRLKNSLIYTSADSPVKASIFCKIYLKIPKISTTKQPRKKHFNYYRFHGLKRSLEKLAAKKVIYKKIDQNGFIKSYYYPTLKIKATEEVHSLFNSISNNERNYILSDIHRKLRANPKLIDKDHDNIKNLHPYLIEQENNTLTNNMDEDLLWVLKANNYIIFHTVTHERYSSAAVINILFIYKVSRIMNDLSSILTSNSYVETNLKSIYQQYIFDKNRSIRSLDSGVAD